MPDSNDATRTAGAHSIDPSATVAFSPLPSAFTDYTPHARGGLGEVLRATDPALNRTVAVKRLLDKRAADPESRRRFLVEAEVTARLEHPGVVPVYGLFTDDRGGPSYAMRFVQGPTLWDALTAYHAGPADPIGFRRLLQSVIQVCQTVAYAHTRGVIHRDLKPQNVLLGKFGETLVVDWGLAKTVGRPDDARADAVGEETLTPGSGGSGDETAMGSAVGTPAFMSPEQAAGRWNVVEHRSDVYGLGAVLYTVLTGKAPLERGDWPEMQQRIQRGDIAHPRQVKADVPRPLEAVCRRAMAVKPEDRYESAADLAADVEHWLADEPVAAYRDPPGARARRWVRRNRTLASAAVVLLLVGLVAAAGGLVLLGRKNREVADKAEAARKSADEAEAVNAFLTDDLLGQANPEVNTRDKQVTVEQVLAKAAAKIDGNPKFADKPAVEATLRLAIGKTYFKLSNLPEAEKHLRRALALRRDHLGPDDPKTLTAQETLADFLNLGPEQFAEAEPLARESWAARTRILGPDHRDTLTSLDTYATSLIGLGQTEAATARYRECLDARRRTLGPDDPDTLISMNNLALTLSEQGRWDESAPVFRDLMVAYDRSGAEGEYAKSASSLFNCLYFQGDLDAAERVLGSAMPRAEQRLGGGNPGHQEVDRLRGMSLRLLVDRGRAGEAADLGGQVVAVRRPMYGPTGAMTASALLDVGRAQVALGRFAAAEQSLHECRAGFAANPPTRPHFLPWADCWWAVSVAGQGRFDEAEPRLLAAEAALRATPSCPRRHHRQAVEQVVKLYAAWGNPAEAAVWTKRLGELPPPPPR